MGAEKNTGCIVVFICEPGDLEIKSLLLSYSLRKFNPLNLKIIAGIQEGNKHKILPSTYRFFNSFHIELFYFINPFTDRRKRIETGDVISNKFYALAQLDHKNHILFLDTDILCLDELRWNLPGKFDIAVKPADYPSSVNWDEVYNFAELAKPKATTVCTVDNTVTPPYFNTGVIFIHKNTLEDLCKAWQKYFLLLTENKKTTEKIIDWFHRDQIAFSLAIQDLKLNWGLLDETFNFPARRRASINSKAVFIHYHDVFTIKKHAQLEYIFREMIHEHPINNGNADSDILWKFLAEKKMFRFTLHHEYRKIKQKMLRIYSKLR